MLREPMLLVLDNHGIGYELRVSLHTSGHVKGLESCRLWVWLHVKEDAHTLYGFYEYAEKEIFMQLVAISGIGPSTALMITSALSPQEIREAILSGHTAVFQAVKGIGTKTAQRLILELRDKLMKTAPRMPLAVGGVATAADDSLAAEDAIAALVSLGIARNMAEKTVATILKEHPGAVSTEQIIKLALKQR